MGREANDEGSSDGGRRADAPLPCTSLRLRGGLTRAWPDPVCSTTGDCICRINWHKPTVLGSVRQGRNLNPIGRTARKAGFSSLLLTIFFKCPTYLAVRLTFLDVLPIIFELRSYLAEPRTTDLCQFVRYLSTLCRASSV